MSVIIHGVPLSQPFRSVAWVCLVKKLPFQVKVAVPGSTSQMGSKSQNFLRMSPTGTVPVLQDGGLSLSESPAILEYLATKYQWSDLLPSEPSERAVLSAVMHWHHSNTRQLSAYFAEKVRPDLLETTGAAAFTVRKHDGVKALNLMENWLLADSPFLAGRSNPSIADFLLYEEVGPLGNKFANLLQLEAYPRIAKWCSEMERQPAFESAHAAIRVLGDISGSHKVDHKLIGAATKSGLKALADAVASVQRD